MPWLLELKSILKSSTMDQISVISAMISAILILKVHFLLGSRGLFFFVHGSFELWALSETTRSLAEDIP